MIWGQGRTHQVGVMIWEKYGLRSRNTSSRRNSQLHKTTNQTQSYEKEHQV